MSDSHARKKIAAKYGRLVVIEPLEQIKPYTYIPAFSRSEARVKEIQAQLRAGNYHIEYEQLADRLLGIWRGTGSSISRFDI